MTDQVTRGSRPAGRDPVAGRPSGRGAADRTGRTAATRRSPRTGRAATGRAPRRHWIAALVTVLTVAVIAVAGYLVFFSTVLGVRTVTVAGATGELATQVRAAVLVPDGFPLVRVDLDGVAHAVERVPAIESAQVRRVWPTGLVVEVTPRTAVALTRANGALWLLDAAGTPYARVAAAPAGLLVIDLATPGTGDPDTLAGLTVARQLATAPASLRDQIGSIAAPSPYAITVALRDGRQIFWGGTDDAAGKIAVLPTVLTRPGQRYDISVPTLVSVR